MSEDRERIERLLEIMREHDLDGLSVRFADSAYELERLKTAAADPAGRSTTGGPQAVAPTAGAGPNTRKVTAPIIGVFYRSPAPGTEPFVEVGDRVSVGQVLCILEAMKLMNEITSDHAGVVTRILPENGQIVSLAEEMFWIEP
jgi:acetyl-CoA carboxylase biotin carboxyl carrier protein